MANSNDAFEGEKTSSLPSITLNSARESHYHGIFSIDGQSKRLDTAEIAGTGDIAPDFSPESNYSKGDPAYYNGVLYYAKSAIIAGIWDASKWEAQPIGARLAALQADIENKFDGLETILAGI